MQWFQDKLRRQLYGLPLLIGDVRRTAIKEIQAGRWVSDASDPLEDPAIVWRAILVARREQLSRRADVKAWIANVRRTRGVPNWGFQDMLAAALLDLRPGRTKSGSQKKVASNITHRLSIPPKVKISYDELDRLLALLCLADPPGGQHDTLLHDPNDPLNKPKDPDGEPKRARPKGSVLLPKVVTAATARTALKLSRSRTDLAALARLGVDWAAHTTAMALHGRTPLCGRELPAVAFANGVREGITRTVTRDGRRFYLPSRQDQVLRELIAVPGSITIVHGPSAAGKSVGIIEAIAKVHPDRNVIAPAARPGAYQSLLDFSSLAPTDTPWVLVINELAAAIISHGLTTHLLRELIAQRPTLVVVAAIRQHELDLLAGTRDATTRLDPDGRYRLADVTAGYHETVDLLRGSAAALHEWDAQPGDRDLDRLIEHIDDPDLRDQIATHGIGSVMVGGLEMLTAHRIMQTDTPAAAAIITATVALVNAGWAAPIPEAAVRELAQHHAPTADLTDPIEFRTARDLAQREVVHNARPVTLAWNDGHHFTPHDYLLDNLATEQPEITPYRALARYAPDFSLEQILANLASAMPPPHQQPLSWAQCGIRQLLNRARQRANSDPGVAFELGRALFRRGQLGDADEGENLWLRSALEGHAAGYYGRGLLSDLAGNTDAELDWYRKAADLGHVDSSYYAACILLYLTWGNDRAAALAEAEERLRYAVNRGDVRSMIALAILLRDHVSGDSLGEAEHLALTARNLAEAEWLLREACDRQQPEALAELGKILEGQGWPEELEAAEAEYRRHADRGHRWGIECLADFLERRGGPGDLDEAVVLNQWLADRGELHAMDVLVRLLATRDAPGDAKEARRWSERRRKVLWGSG